MRRGPWVSVTVECGFSEAAFITSAKTRALSARVSFSVNEQSPRLPPAVPPHHVFPDSVLVELGSFPLFKEEEAAPCCPGSHPLLISASC